MTEAGHRLAHLHHLEPVRLLGGKASGGQVDDATQPIHRTHGRRRKLGRMAVEFYVPGRASARMAADHEARYRFACQWAYGRRVLDAACGSGYGTSMLVEAGAELAVGIDRNEQALAYAEEHYASDRVLFERGDVQRLPYRGGFDRAVSFETVEHVEDHRALLRGLYDALDADGVLLLSTPNRNVTSPGRSPLNEHHVREFTAPEILRELREVGFRPQSVSGQRRQPRMPAARLQRLYARLMRPARRSSPRVRPVGALVVGRILVIVAIRP
jgi:2-polyprenyl-3-methyl-5-hydroxy-6-metoxy-1,4-benzoquinol methylase